jgi:predicted HicB family RNase H-like nuclease
MATSIKFNDYVASIEYDADIEMFFGRVMNLSSPVTFYGASVEELRREFANSIQAYLEVCRERGIEPEKPYSGRINIRTTPEQHRRFARQAAMAGKSLNNWALETMNQAQTGESRRSL